MASIKGELPLSRSDRSIRALFNDRDGGGRSRCRCRQRPNPTIDVQPRRVILSFCAFYLESSISKTIHAYTPASLRPRAVYHVRHVAMNVPVDPII